MFGTGAGAYQTLVGPSNGRKRERCETDRRQYCDATSYVRTPGDDPNVSLMGAYPVGGSSLGRGRRSLRGPSEELIDKNRQFVEPAFPGGARLPT